MSPSVAGEVTIPEQGVDDYVCAVKLVVYELVYGFVLLGYLHQGEQVVVVRLEGCGMRGDHLVQTDYLVHHVAAAAFVVEGLDRLAYLPGLEILDSGIPFDQKINQITKAQRAQLVQAIKRMELTPTAFRPIEEAIVTAGGVATEEISQRTMESKLVKGLYFAGEVLDIDGDTGGYNLQAAFSTGMLAGESAAGSLSE